MWPLMPMFPNLHDQITTLASCSLSLHVSATAFGPIHQFGYTVSHPPSKRIIGLVEAELVAQAGDLAAYSAVVLGRYEAC